jgi:glyoxylase-like metal-dependent hydrolase (beta-lactamase superfamily II)
LRWFPFNSAFYAVEPGLMRVGAPPGPALRITTTWSVLAHPQGIVVIDTGAPPGDPAAEMPEGSDVRSRLAGVGIRADDVAYVVNTHLHVDHVGGNPALTGARILVDRDELAYAREPADPELAAEYPRQHLALDSLSYELLADGDVDLFGDGAVVVLETPGHAAGHRSVLVRLPRTGPVLVTGDAVWTRDNLDDSALPGVLWSGPAYRRSRARLRRLAAAEGARWFFAHEPACFTREGWEEGVAYD